MPRILQICTGHKHKWLTQFGAGPAIACSDTMLNTMLKHTHGVWGRWTHTQETQHTMKDKREAFLFSIIQRCTFIVQWCDSWFHIPRSLGLHCDFSHSTPTHVGLGVPTSPLNLKGYVWVQEKSCNTNLQSIHGSTWAESTLWNVGKKRWFKDDHQHWNSMLIVVLGTLPKLERN